MKTGILGTGAVGKSLANGFQQTGHEVRIGGREQYNDLAAFAELAVLAVPGAAAEDLLRQLGGQRFAGKIVLDVMNPIAAALPVDGVIQVFTGPNDSLGERVQKLLPQSKVVKAFNSVGHELFFRPRLQGGPATMFFCGNDAGARATLAAVIRDFGWEPYDCGAITAARVLEPLCGLWCLPGFVRNDWTHAFKVLS